MYQPSSNVEETVRQDLQDALAECPANAQDEMIRRIAELVRREVNRERDRNVEMCLHRSELWQKTLLAESSSPEQARAEARARGNEARYLADIIASESKLVSIAGA